LAGAIDRVKRLEGELRRWERKEAASAFKAAAEAGDPEASAIMRELR
jgi:hypothetical protein